MRQTKEERSAADEEIREHLLGRVIVPARIRKGDNTYRTIAVNPKRRRINDMARTLGMTRKQYKKHTKKIRTKIFKERHD